MTKKAIAKKGFNFNKAFQTDTDKELEGSWTKLSMGGEEMDIMLARKGNNNAQNYLRELLRVNEVALKPNDTKANELFLEIQKKVIARCIIVDWEGVEIDGDIIPYTEEVCIKLLKFTDFFNAVEEASGNFAIFRAEENATILKN